MVWAIPRSIATTKGITVVFFSSAYLDVSVQRVRPRYNLVTRSPVPGCPIRKSADQESFAPPRSLSQLITSFFASESQGILRTPLLTFLLFKALPKAHGLIRSPLRTAPLASLFLFRFFQHVNELSPSTGLLTSGESNPSPTLSLNCLPPGRSWYLNVFVVPPRVELGTSTLSV